MKVFFLLRKEKAYMIREGYGSKIMLLLFLHIVLLSGNSLR